MLISLLNVLLLAVSLLIFLLVLRGFILCIILLSASVIAITRLFFEQIRNRDFRVDYSLISGLFGTIFLFFLLFKPYYAYLSVGFFLTIYAIGIGLDGYKEKLVLLKKYKGNIQKEKLLNILSLIFFLIFSLYFIWRA